jgi:hypothetical protein
VLDTGGRILELLTPILALGAGVLAVRGKGWDEVHGHPTRFGWWAVLLAGLTMIVSISNSLVSHELAENAKKTADKEKTDALIEQASRFDRVDHATAEQLRLLREQLLQQGKTLAVANATRQSQMPVESVTITFTATPASLQRMRAIIRSSFPTVEDSEHPWVSYERDRMLLINGKDVAPIAGNSIGSFLTHLWSYVFGIEITSAVTREVIDPGHDLISSFAARNSGVSVTLAHLPVSATFFYNRPVYLRTLSLFPADLPSKIEVLVGGAEFTGRGNCQIDWQTKPTQSTPGGPCSIPLTFGVSARSVAPSTKSR